MKRQSPRQHSVHKYLPICFAIALLFKNDSVELKKVSAGYGTLQLHGRSARALYLPAHKTFCDWTCQSKLTGFKVKWHSQLNVVQKPWEGIAAISPIPVKHTENKEIKIQKKKKRKNPLGVLMFFFMRLSNIYLKTVKPQVLGICPLRSQHSLM